jgi:hypothetical protein
MKRFKNIFNKTTILVVTMVLWGTGCELWDIEDRPDPNNTELKTIIENPSRAEVNTLATGTLAGLRTDLNLYFVDVGMIGREVYRFLAAEPRFTGDLLGKENAQLDAGSFYITRPWAAHYSNIRNANILIESVNTVSDPDVLTDQEKNGIFGFAKTIKAYQYLLTLNLTHNNGIREQNQADLFTPGQPLSMEGSFNVIESLLDEGANDLESAGSEFAIRLSTGFGRFNTPATFRQFNRALRARVAAYRGDWQSTLDALDESFIDANADLTFGVYHVFSPNTNDQLNSMFADPNAGTGDSWVAHPSWVADAEAGDQRVEDKVVERNSTASLDNLSSDYGLFVYKEQDSPVPIIRNAELILLRAEALAQRNQAGDLDEAEDDINVIRSAAGLDNFDRGVTGGQEEVIDEMLRQRRYELFFEGHRWIDMRRYDRFDELPIDREGDNVWEEFPIPENENL